MKSIKCRFCFGTGRHPDILKGYNPCPICSGLGEVTIDDSEELIDCRFCFGTGRDPDMLKGYNPCQVCKGYGMIKKPKMKSINKHMIKSKKPKITRRKIDKNTRDAVWIKYMRNNVEGKCYCCKIRSIHITDFQVGHNKAVAKGGIDIDNINNLRPICGPCNRGMGTMSIEEYRKIYFSKPTKKDIK